MIKVSDTPPPPKKMSRVMTEFLNAFNALKKDKVLKMVPDEGKSLCGLKTSVARMTSTQGLKVDYWDDGQALYVRHAQN